MLRSEVEEQVLIIQSFMDGLKSDIKKDFSLILLDTSVEASQRALEIEKYSS